MLRDYCRGVLDLIFPLTCYACGQYEPLRDHQLCGPCLEVLPWIYNHTIAQATLEGRAYFPAQAARTHSLLFFTKKGKAQQLIQEIKYHGQKQLAVYMGSQLGLKIAPERELENYILIPVPIHKKRLRSRGYNQAEEIAKGIQEVLNITIKNGIIKRTKFESSQTTKNERQRAHVLDLAFSPGVSDADLVEKSVILVDDVITTGATIRACVNVLTNMGFRHIEVASLAISI